MNELSGVLEAFGLGGASVEPLGDSQNRNHRVMLGEQSFLLRQHRSEANSTAALESEMLWLTYLSAHGLEVQRPMPLASGGFILERSGQRFSVLSWIEGEVFETLNAAQAEALGALMARSHGVAEGFEVPEGFERPRYGAAYLEATLAELRRIAWLGADLPLFERATARARVAFRDDAQWGLIHADAHPGNLVWRDEEPVLIDFDRCGFGPAGFDLTSALGYLEDAEQTAFLGGYASVRPLPEGFAAQRRAFTVAEWLTNLAFLAPRPQDREFVDTVMLPGLRAQLPEMLELISP